MSDVTTDKQLTDDPAELKKIIKEQAKTIALLEEQIEYWKNELYGRKSEKYTPEDEFQSELFNEAEMYSEPMEDEEEEIIDVPAHTKRKKGRRPIPESIPREVIIHALPDEELQCPCGSEYEKIGEEVSEKLAIIPAQVYVERHIRYKYACKSCEGVDNEEDGAVKIAPPPVSLIPKSLATPSLLAYLFASKFCDALPFYRIGKILNRMGIDLSRQTMCRWAIRVAEALKLFMDLMKEELLSGNVIGADETTHQVIKEPDRNAVSKSYMWVFRGGQPDKPVVLYKYRETRSGEFLKDYLSGFQGHVVCDAYAGYNHLEDVEGIILAGCWAHVRRKFFDAAKISKKKTGGAHVAIAQIKKLYLVEREAKNKKLLPDERKELRQEKSKLHTEKFKEWLDDKADKVAPKTLLGTAVNYTIKIWGKLLRYLEAGEVPIDNNFTENVIRPFVVGRRNWLFSFTPNGAGASAALYSIAESAKANDLEPYWYYKVLFEKLPYVKTREEMKQLLPMYIDPRLARPPDG